MDLIETSSRTRITRTEIPALMCNHIFSTQDAYLATGYSDHWNSTHTSSLPATSFTSFSASPSGAFSVDKNTQKNYMDTNHSTITSAGRTTLNVHSVSFWRGRVNGDECSEGEEWVGGSIVLCVQVGHGVLTP